MKPGSWFLGLTPRRSRDVPHQRADIVPADLLTQVLVDELWCRVGDDLPDVRDATLRACERVARAFVVEHPELLMMMDLDLVDELMCELLDFARGQDSGVVFRDQPWPLYWMPEGLPSEPLEPLD